MATFERIKILVLALSLFIFWSLIYNIIIKFQGLKNKTSFKKRCVFS